MDIAGENKLCPTHDCHVMNDRTRNLLQSSENGINGDCYGRVTTSCESQIINWDALSVVSHRDKTGALCEAHILAAETENGSKWQICECDSLD